MKIGLVITAVVALLGFNAQVSTVWAQGATAFTYQGLLRNNGTNVTGTNGLIFTLEDTASGSGQIGTPITNSVAVSNGLFTATLDFGAGAFNGSARWLDIAVSNGAANQELSPRTQILPTPYATFAAAAASASNFTGTVVQGSFVGYGGGLTNVGAMLQMQVFSNPGTFSFTAPTNVTTIIIEAWGGGGGGGSGSASYDVGGGGGGAGGYTKYYTPVTPGQSYQVIVGAGGNAGQAGGTSSMGGIPLSTGGSPGTTPNSISVTAGGAGGSGYGTSSTTSGIRGGTGKFGTPDGGGDGGDAPCGGPGGLGSFGTGAEAGHFPGGGGGGGDYAGTAAGAAGGNGEVIVYY